MSCSKPATVMMDLYECLISTNDTSNKQPPGYTLETGRMTMTLLYEMECFTYHELRGDST